MTPLNKVVLSLGFLVLFCSLWGLLESISFRRLPIGLGVALVVGCFMTWKAKYAPRIAVSELMTALANTILSFLICIIRVEPDWVWISILIASALTFSLTGTSLKTVMSRNDDAWRRKKSERESRIHKTAPPF